MFNLKLHIMEKKILNVDNRGSFNLSLLRTFFIFISVLMLIVSVILIVVAFVEYEEEYIPIGFSLALSAIGILIFTLPFIRGFITIVESAEYVKAEIISKYEIELEKPNKTEKK